MIRRPLYCVLFSVFLGLAAYFVAEQGWHSPTASAFFGLAASVVSVYYRLAGLLLYILTSAAGALVTLVRGSDA